MKILIIDDESLARDILKNQLNKFHYEDIFMADNGEGALKILEEKLPDVVFLDICMPEMSGIELMERAVAFRKQFVYIILSGYNLFEYAQRTMELGAYKYLLKPVDDCKLKEAMESVEIKLKISKIEKEKYVKLKLSRTKDRNSLKKRYIHEIISGTSNDSQNYNNMLPEEPIMFCKSIFQICCISIKECFNSEIVSDDQDIIQFGIENIISEITQLYKIDVYFFTGNKINGVLMNYEQTGINFKEVYRQIFINIQEFIGCFKKTEITLGVGKEVLGSEKLQEAYNSAKETVNKRLILGGGTIYFASENYLNDIQNSDSKLIIEESIIKSIYQNDSRQIQKYVDDLYAPYINSMLADVKRLNKMHLNLFVLLHKELEKKEIDSSQILDNEFSLYNKIQTLDTIEEMKEFLLRNILLCMEALKQQIGVGNEKIMIRAKEFIEHNIGHNLTLESVAWHVNFSPAYFSKFFKNEEGLNFIDYVNKMRIEEAKKLLNKNVKTADICERIGFLDVKHFYKVFKRWEGITPGQYKKGLL